MHTRIEDIYANYRERWPSHHALYDGTNPTEIALTFDDGPSEPFTSQLLEVLHERNVTATFFMIGKWVQQFAEVARAVHGAGHLIGNHTYQHPVLSSLPLKVVRQELDSCQKAIEDATGEIPDLFRPPFGATSDDVDKIALELGMRPVLWSVTPVDWELNVTPDSIVRRVLMAIGSRKQGEIILLHDGGDGADRSSTVAAVRNLIRHSAAGRQFVSIAQFTR